VALLWAVVSAARNRRDGQNIALRRSREPPAVELSGRRCSPSAKFVAFETVRAKAAPLQAFGSLDTQRVGNSSAPQVAARTMQPARLTQRSQLCNLQRDNNLARFMHIPSNSNNMKTRANLGRMPVLLGVVLCFADFVSAAESPKTVNTCHQRTGAVTGQLTGTFGNQVVNAVAETVTLTPLSGGQAITTKTSEVGRFLFQNVPPGQYELRTQFEWSTGYVEAYDDGTRDRMWVDHSRAIAGQVQVKPNQTARVTKYTVGPTQDGGWAYGGLVFPRPHHPLVTCDS
jgi:hypothetical protein